MMRRKAFRQFATHLLLLRSYLPYKDSFFMSLWHSGPHLSHATLNEVKQCIRLQNKRRLGVFNLKKGNAVPMQPNRSNSLFGIRKVLHFMLNRPKPDPGFLPSKILKFHVQDSLLESFFLKHTKKLLSIIKQAVPQEDVEKQWGGPEAYKLITFIKDDFNAVINKNPKVIVFFSADWCHHCRRLRALYGTAALMAKEANIPVVFATLDVGKNPDIADENGIVGIPIIKYYNNGKVVATFRGKRTVDDLFAFAKDPESGKPDFKKADI